MEKKFTTGPWYYSNDDESLAIFHPTQIGDRICVIEKTFSGQGWNARENEEWKGNATLICSAPDLLDALELIIPTLEAMIYEQWGQDFLDKYTPIIKAKEVINKAYGNNI